MDSPSPEALHAQIRERLTPHGSQDLRNQLASVVDLDALNDRRYREVLETVDHRLSTIHYSLISMLVAGIYFGLLVGNWLVDLSSWQGILLWVVPVGLVTLYAVYAAHQTIREILHLSEARSLLQTLTERSTPTP